MIKFETFLVLLDLVKKEKNFLTQKTLTNYVREIFYRNLYHFSKTIFIHRSSESDIYQRRSIYLQFILFFMLHFNKFSDIMYHVMKHKEVKKC